jgi:drug/metabolite transporter (DMT)-like permease
VLLMLGLARLPASQASLLLNGEAVLTALLAWVVFRENVDRRVGFGMAAIVAGGVVLAWPGAAAGAGSGAAACWCSAPASRGPSTTTSRARCRWPTRPGSRW